MQHRLLPRRRLLYRRHPLEAPQGLRRQDPPARENPQLARDDIRSRATFLSVVSHDLNDLFEQAELIPEIDHLKLYGAENLSDDIGLLADQEPMVSIAGSF